MSSPMNITCQEGDELIRAFAATGGRFWADIDEPEEGMRYGVVSMRRHGTLAIITRTAGGWHLMSEEGATMGNFRTPAEIVSYLTQNPEGVTD